MTDRPRPYIPMSVRVQVAERQLGPNRVYAEFAPSSTLGQKLQRALEYLGFEQAQLDHDPALILRKFNKRTGRYTPDANDPDFLIYRRKDDHQQKTTGRKPGAERTVTTKGSDIGIKTKFARLERKGKRRKQKIPGRKNPWPRRSMGNGR